MNKCEHLENGKCKAFVVHDGGFKIITHVPKFCATDMSIGGNEFQPQVRFIARCVVAENREDQKQCDDFKPEIEHWSGSNQY